MHPVRVWSVILAAVGYFPWGSGCSSGVDPQESELPEFARQVETYRDGKFIYEGGTCAFLPANSTTVLTFACGELIIGLKVGVTVADLADLLREISATIRKDRSDRKDYPWLGVSVPVRTERSAILRAFDDARVRYATPNINGPASLFNR